MQKKKLKLKHKSVSFMFAIETIFLIYTVQFKILQAFSNILVPYLIIIITPA